MSNKIENIRRDAELAPFICEECYEKGVGVELHPSLTNETAVIVKIDSYYASLKLADTVPSADCLIFQDAENQRFCLFVVELKSQNYSAGLSIEQLRDKFETSLNDFVAKRFKSHFVINPAKYKKIRCYLRSKINPGYTQKARSLSLEALINKPIIFRCTYINTEFQLRVPIERLESGKQLPIG
ncbi:MAG: hypothetical protein MUF71_09415 [Candidatus Kapabacteria bacterium]|jgi:hypothetical protein|nr:hypothetical protein [Candidatus Kapabacteria bacterium]